MIPAGLKRLGLAGGQGQDVLGGLFLNNALLALAFIQGLDELTCEVFFLGEDAQALARPGLDLGRIGAHERRSADDALVSDDGEIEREVVAFDAPAPWLAGTGW